MFSLASGGLRADGWQAVDTGVLTLGPRRARSVAAAACVAASALSLGCGASNKAPTSEVTGGTGSSTGTDATGGSGKESGSQSGSSASGSPVVTSGSMSTSPPLNEDAGGAVFPCHSGPPLAPPMAAWNGPSLTAGTWKNITPPALKLPATPPPFGIAWVEIDPNNLGTLYATADTEGLWKTTDSGVTWKVLGDPSKVGHPVTAYLDSPIAVRVDWNDSTHMYATQGVRGVTLGFWVSIDSGNTWTEPAGFNAVAAKVGGDSTHDVTQMAVDPIDFCHILVSYHSTWAIAGGNSSGFIESRDGGNNWTIHLPPNNVWSTGSKGVHFLHDPAQNIGDANTWLITDDGTGFWRTADAGMTWAHVMTIGSTHGGGEIYYASNGYVYTGGQEHPVRSKDNGVTWETLMALPYSSYYTVYGDGNLLYTQMSFTGNNGGQGLQPYWTSPETDGLTWTKYNGAAQTFADGPFSMRFDPVHRVMYSANWDTGLWALKVTP